MHPYEVSMQILNAIAYPNVLGGSVKVSDQFIYILKN